MKELIENLKEELKNMENDYDFYDNSDLTRKIKASEQRQLERLIQIAEAIYNLK